MMTPTFLPQTAANKGTPACPLMFSGYSFVGGENKYQAALQNIAENFDPEAGFEVIEAPEDEIIPLEEHIGQNVIVFRDMYLQFSGRENNLHV